MWIIWISFLVAQWLTYTGKVKGVAHNIFISSYQTPEIFALSFDDQTNELQLNRIMFGHGGHPWLTFNRDRTILYGAELDGWSSYRVKGPTDLQFTNFIQASSRCSTAAARHGETVMAVSKFPPYPVYGASSSPCGAVIGTRTDGRLDRIIQNITYTRDSHVQGMALDPQGRYLFSADGNGNSLWFHQVNKNTGRLEGVEEIDFPLNDVNPRRIVIHPSGQFLYVLLQRTSQVAVFELAPESGNRKPTLRYTNLTISLIPSSMF
jgi:carboxy-cis,cis-muconate cyclase